MTTRTHTNRGRRAVATAGLGLALAAGLVVAAPTAGAAAKPTLSPTSGPVGTSIKVTGSCGDPSGGTWLAPKIALYYANAFETGAGGPSTFAEATGTVTSAGAYSGSIKVPATATYTSQGSGPAMPGPEVKNRPVTGQIRVQVQCMSSLSSFPWTQEFSPFDVTAAAKLKVVTRPAISGQAKVGKKLKASTGAWSPAPTAYDYQWYRGKKAIDGKKGERKKYKVVAADLGKKLKVTVTASRAGYGATSATSKKVKIKG